MQPYSEQEIKKHLRYLVWDVNLTADDLYDLLTGKVQNIHGLDKRWLYARILNSFKWHNILRIVPHSEIAEMLNEQVIVTLFPPSVRELYRNARRFLHENAVSFTG